MALCDSIKDLPVSLIHQITLAHSESLLTGTYTIILTLAPLYLNKTWEAKVTVPMLKDFSPPS